MLETSAPTTSQFPGIALVAVASAPATSRPRNSLGNKQLTGIAVIAVAPPRRKHGRWPNQRTHMD
eukprot:13716073-Alexandrium_andersonii.AAC.1